MTTITLKADATRFYSSYDEDAFFGWLKAIGCVVNFYGRGKTLYIDVASGKLTEESLRELLALFRRYDVEMKQLAQFASDANHHWFSEPTKYWHSDVFGSGEP
ncbi:hypothetical protein [Filomicrobium insigne]|nr:hypothetical protein [Filomicrobium insigne]